MIRFVAGVPKFTFCQYNATWCIRFRTKQLIQQARNALATH